MSKVVIKLTVSALGTERMKFSQFVHIFDVTKIGTRINATLRNETGDVNRRFAKEDFDKLSVDVDFNRGSASIMYLVDKESEVNVQAEFTALTEALLNKFDRRIAALISFRAKIYAESQKEG